MVQVGVLEEELSDLGLRVPHAPPMRLLDALVRADDEGARARLKVDPRAWYADGDGALPGWFGLELMAQTIAAYSGATKGRQGLPPRIGYLLGTRSYTCATPAFPADALLEVDVTSLFRDEAGLWAFDCTLEQDGTTVATAQLKVYEAP